MPSLYRLKPAFQKRLRPLCGVLARRGVTANQVTVATVGIAACHAAWSITAAEPFWPLLALPALLLLRLALNALDGMLAREHGQESRLGGVLNELADLASDALFYLPLALVPGVPAGVLIAAVFLGWLAEAAGMAAVQIGAARRHDGPFGKSDRALAFGLFALLLAIGPPPAPWLLALLGVLCGSAVWTIYNRVSSALNRNGTVS